MYVERKWMNVKRMPPRRSQWRVDIGREHRKLPQHGRDEVIELPQTARGECRAAQVGDFAHDDHVQTMQVLSQALAVVDARFASDGVR